MVLENDEICYNADDLLPVCEELEIPLVFGESEDYIDQGIFSDLLSRLSPRLDLSVGYERD